MQLQLIVSYASRLLRVTYVCVWSARSDLANLRHVRFSYSRVAATLDILIDRRSERVREEKSFASQDSSPSSGAKCLRPTHTRTHTTSIFLIARILCVSRDCQLQIPHSHVHVYVAFVGFKFHVWICG